MQISDATMFFQGTDHFCLGQRLTYGHTTFPSSLTSMFLWCQSNASITRGGNAKTFVFSYPWYDKRNHEKGGRLTSTVKTVKSYELFHIFSAANKKIHGFLLTLRKLSV